MQPFKFNKMPEETNTASQVEQPRASEAPDWSLLQDLSNNQEVKIDNQNQEKVEQKTDPDSPANNDIKIDESELNKEKPTENNSEEKPNESKEPKATEPKATEGEIKPEFEIKLEDLADVPKEYAKDSWQELARDLGQEIAEDSFDSFKDNFVPKSEIEKIKGMTKTELLAQYKPETAAHIELLELGLPEELISNPTRVVDENIARTDELVKLSDVDLYRLVLESTEGMTPDMIETELDELTSNGKIVHKAQMERINLMNDKKTFQAQRQNILDTRDNLITKHTQDRERVLQQKKEQESALFLKTLNDKSDFMGVPIPKEVKDGIARKFQGGLYDNALSEAENKINLILYKELGAKFSKLIKDSAFAKGKEGEIIKQANIPPISSASGGQRVIAKNEENDNESPFAIIREDFGKK